MQYVEVTSRNQAYYQTKYGIHESGVYVPESEYCTDLVLADRIVSINGVAIQSVSDFEAAFDGLSVDDTVSIEASRNNEPFTTTIVLREYVPDYIKNRTE